MSRLLHRLPLMSQALGYFIAVGALVVLTAIGAALGWAWALNPSAPDYPETEGN